jgi:hypothetical protein
MTGTEVETVVWVWVGTEVEAGAEELEVSITGEVV